MHPVPTEQLVIRPDRQTIARLKELAEKLPVGTHNQLAVRLLELSLHQLEHGTAAEGMTKLQQHLGVVSAAAVSSTELSEVLEKFQQLSDRLAALEEAQKKKPRA